MSSGLGSAVYARLPVALQNLACSALAARIKRRRYGAAFEELSAWLDETARWSLEELEAYQDERLAALVRHAYETVPYWTRTLDDRKLKPGDIRGRADLPKLPLLTKDIVIREGEAMQSRGVPRRETLVYHSSGTTGAGLRFRVSRRLDALVWAVAWRHRGRHGLTLGEPHVNFSGQIAVPLAQRRPPFWREARPLNMTYLSLYHLSAENLPHYVAQLDSRPYAYYVGYPSALYLLADHLRASGTRLKHPPRWLVTSSESLLPHQIEAFAAGIGAPVTDLYGQAEVVALMTRCREGRYHAELETTLIEAPSGAGAAPVPIVGTSLHNWAQPFIRYETGDLARFAGSRCGCGLSTPSALSIDGRIESYIVTPDGRRVGRLDHCFKDLERVRECQIVQSTVERIEARVVPRPGWSDEDASRLRDELRRHLGPSLAIEVRVVERLPRTATGKLRSVISKVPATGARDLELLADELEHGNS